jgi:hypothetical protein
MGRWRNSAVVPLAIATLLLATTSCSGPPDNVQVNGRTLLTYSAGSTRADAALEGVLHANSAGCLAVGTLVLVVPTGSRLNSDGSIVVDGTTYTLGSAIQLGGGGGRSPHPNPCGQHVQYWYV